MAKPARNDPCTCGSGKKYKKCCLRKNEAAVMGDLNWIRMRRTEGELVPVLLKHLEKQYGPEAMREAWDDFTVWTDLPMDPEESPEFESGFPPWLLFNWDPDPAAEGREDELPDIPVALHYLQTRPERLDSYQQRFIAEACRQPYSFFQVTATDPGQEMGLRDIMLQREVTVKERTSSVSLKPGNIVFSRVVEMDGDAIMLGCAPIMIPGQFFDQIVGFREHLAEHMTVTRETLHDYDIELRTLYFDLRAEVLDPAPPRIQNTDGDPLQMTRLHYALHCPVREALDALLPLTLEDDRDSFYDEGTHNSQGELIAVDIPWKMEGNRQNPGWDNTVLGHIEIDGDTLTVSVNSQPRAEKIEALIADLLGKQAELKRQEIESLDSLREKADRRKRTAEGAEEEALQRELMAQPEARARMQEMMDEHWRTWPDIPLPALGGVSPREAAKTPLGRERLEALLLEFEGRDDVQEGLRPDCAALRRELGI